MSKKKKTDISIIVNILFIAVFIAAGVFLYTIFSKDNFAVLKKTAKDTYNDKAQQQLQIPERPKETQKVELPPFNKYKFKYIYDIDVQGYLKKLNVEILVPSDEKEKQYISDFNISIKPTRMYNNGSSNIAEYEMENINNQHVVFVLEGIANVRTYDIKLAKLINKNLTPENDLTKYLQPEPYIESNDAMIQNIAKKIKGSTKEEIVQNIYEYAQENMNYAVIAGTLGAKKALQMKQGKCSEFSAIMVALCRAKNIPARIVVGHIARKEVPQHGWVEVYYDEYGWVTYDPTRQATIVSILDANGKLIRKEKRYDATSKLNYIASGRNSWNMLRMHFTTSSTQNGSARIKETIEIDKI